MHPTSPDMGVQVNTPGEDTFRFVATARSSGPCGREMEDQGQFLAFSAGALNATWPVLL